MPADGPPVVVGIETKYVASMKGKTFDIAKSYTNEFVDKAS